MHVHTFSCRAWSSPCWCPQSISGEIEFRDVRFAYPSRPSVIIFNNFNLTMTAGCVTALVGESGSGKSTVVGLIERFYDPLAGSVLLDGMDVRDYNLRYLRAQVRASRGGVPRVATLRQTKRLVDMSGRCTAATDLVLRMTPPVDWAGEPGAAAVQRHRRGQHPHRQAGCHAGGAPGGGRWVVWRDQGGVAVGYAYDRKVRLRLTHMSLPLCARRGRKCAHVY